MEKAKKRNKIIKRIFIIAFVILNIVVIAVTALKEFGNGGDAADLGQISLKWWMLIPALICFLVAVFAEVYKYYIVMRDTWASQKKFDKKKGMRISRETVLLGRYYDNITPAAVGGQPFQIYYMNKSGVKGGFGTVIPLMGMITDQLAFLVVGLFSIVVGSFAGWVTDTAVVAAGFFGLLCYAFFPVLIMLATFLPKATDEIIGIFVKFLAKLHIIKKPDEATAKARASVKEYASCVKIILKRKKLFWKTMAFSALNYICMMLIPFFVLQTFGADVNIFMTFTTMAAISAAVYFVPTPGNAGAAEGVFYGVFSAVGGYVFWAMLFWRLFAYYSFLIIGLITQFVVYTRDKNILKAWHRDKEKAEETVEITTGREVKEAEAKVEAKVKQAEADLAQAKSKSKPKSDHEAHHDA